MELAHNTPTQEAAPAAELKTLILKKTSNLTRRLRFGYIPFFVLVDKKTKGNLSARDIIHVVVDDDMVKMKVVSLEKMTLVEIDPSRVEDCMGYHYPDALQALNLQYNLLPLSDVYVICLQEITRES